MMEFAEETDQPSRHLFRRLAARGRGPLTLTLMIASAILFVVGYRFGFGKIAFLFLTNFDITNANDITLWRSFLERCALLSQVFPEIRHGEIWRLFTPMLVHINFLQLFFNLLWLWWLGNGIEMRQGSWMLLLLILTLAVISNLVGYFFVGPAFAGMAGVVYGLAGYTWIRGKFDPQSRLAVHFFITAMMSIWGVVCLVGIMGPVVNAAHMTGLLSGMAWGFLSSPGGFIAKLRPKSAIRLNWGAK